MFDVKMVREERLELSRLATLEPKSSASTNSATLACLPAGSGPVRAAHSVTSHGVLQAENAAMAALAALLRPLACAGRTRDVRVPW